MDVLEYIKKMQEMYGDDVITTADKLEKPPKTVVREIFEDFNARNPKADGGQLVAPSVDGSRPGYSGKYGPNIRKKKGQNLLEVTLNRDNKTYYDSFSYGDVNRTGPKPKYPNEEAALKAANKFKDSVKTLPKATGKVTPKFLEARRKRKGTISETGKKAEIRKILNKFIAEGKTSFSNEDVKNLIDKDLFDTDKNFRTAVDVVKKENAFKNLNFIVKQRDRADFFTDPFIRNKIKENYKKLKQENLAKLVFPDDPLTTSKARLNTILTDMTDKGEIERRKAGEFSEERIQEFDPSPEAEKRAKIGKRRRKKIDILGSKDYEKELYNFKKEVQENLGLEKVKKGKYDPIDMGHQSSIKQLKALKQSLRPEDLSPQFYKANQLGIQKYEGGVKTLENSLNRKFYPEQKKLYKQAQKFINAGKAVPEDLQNKIIKSNERIQIFIDDTVKKYPLLKDRVNAVTMDPINLDVKRGGNVFKQLGIGLVDQDLGKIKTGSLDDLTIKVNLAEQTLKEAIDAGLIDEKVGRQRLDKFFKVGNVDKLKKLMSFCPAGTKVVKAAADGGRMGYADGPMCTPEEAARGMQQEIKKVQSGTASKGEASRTVNKLKNFGTKGMRGLLKAGLISEVLFEAALGFDKVISEGQSPMQAFRQSYLTAPLRAIGAVKSFEEGEREELLKSARDKGKVSRVLNLQNLIGDRNKLINKINNLKSNLNSIRSIGGDTFMAEKNLAAAQAKLQDMSRSGKLSTAEKLFSTKPQDLKLKDKSLIDAYNQAFEKRAVEQASRSSIAQSIAADRNRLRDRMNAEGILTTQDAKNELQYIGDYFGQGYTPYGVNKLLERLGFQNPGYGITKIGPATGKYNQEQGLQDFLNAMRTQTIADAGGVANLAGGGLASLTNTIPPKSGPMSQGLRSLYNNGRKL